MIWIRLVQQITDINEPFDRMKVLKRELPLRSDLVTIVTVLLDLQKKKHKTLLE